MQSFPLPSLSAKKEKKVDIKFGAVENLFSFVSYKPAPTTEEQPVAIQTNLALN